MDTPIPTQEPDYKEVYQQRYETYRHLDNLRWQMMQIGVTAASVTFAFSMNGSSTPDWWTWLGVGTVLIFSGIAMLKIGSGISVNAEMLRLAGSKLGDTQLPEPSKKRFSVAFWIASSMVTVGTISILVPLTSLVCK